MQHIEYHIRCLLSVVRRAADRHAHLPWAVAGAAHAQDDADDDRPDRADDHVCYEDGSHLELQECQPHCCLWWEEMRAEKTYASTDIKLIKHERYTDFDDAANDVTDVVSGRGELEGDETKPHVCFVKAG